MPFDIGFFELCLVVIVALLVLGPERLPVAARALGRWIGKAQRAFVSVKNEINRELQLDELRQQLKQQQQQMEQLLNQQELSDLQRQIEETRAAFRQEMQQQQSHLQSSSSTTAAAKSQSDNESLDSEAPKDAASNRDDKPQEKQQPNSESNLSNTADLAVEEELSGCKNPVEFEPLPRNHEQQTNTIHPEPKDPKSGS
jgi:sec-independent protein translocase protein TatB